MFSFKSVYFVIFTIILHLSQAIISDKRLCIDEKCSGTPENSCQPWQQLTLWLFLIVELISVGKTIQKYHSPEEGLLSFGPNVEVKVYSYGAGTRPELIGVEIGGKRGYVNKMFIRETNLHKRPKLLIDTELRMNRYEVPLTSETLEIKADSTLEPYEIVDGTKIPLNNLPDNVEVAPSTEKVESTTPLPSGKLQLETESAGQML